jgi:hypothetical protein
MRPAIYTTLMTIRDADVAAPIALIRIGTTTSARRHVRRGVVTGN